MSAVLAETPARPLLSVRGLTKHFPLKGGLFGGSGGVVRAVDGITFDVFPGETLGIVGESGCGKSTTARLLVDLIRADSGDFILEGRHLGRDLSVRDLRRAVQMVFQDSYASLNPRLTMEEAIAFGPQVNGVDVGKATGLAHELLNKVGLDPKRFAGRYPHELSGGQRQRVNIARALAFQPKVVILDEAVSALDKSVEAQVLNLLGDLKAELGLTYIFISHDLNVVRHMSDRVMVMYLGEVAEIGPVEEIYAQPTHPYTRALLAAKWRDAASACSAGAFWLHTGAAWRHRVWNRQPGGGLIGFGGSPASGASRVRRSGSMEGIAASSARV
jgi:peptide/nickel transport system ATP-binding protein